MSIIETSAYSGTSKKRCIQCNKIIPEESVYCPYCGKYLVSANPDPDPDVPPEIENPNNWYLKILPVLLVFTIVAVVAF